MTNPDNVGGQNPLIPRLKCLASLLQQLNAQTACQAVNDAITEIELCRAAPTGGAPESLVKWERDYDDTHLAPYCREDVKRLLADWRASIAAPAGGDDLYRQACDSVEEWKARALEAEADIACIHAQINAENGPTFMGEPVVSAPAWGEPNGKLVGWWNGITPGFDGMGMPSIRWGADAEDSRHDIPLYDGYNPIHYVTPVSAPAGSGEVEAQARALYSRWVDQQDIHCNRFPSWQELSAKDRQEWFDKVVAADTGNAAVDRVIGRLMSSDPDFDDCAEAAALLRKLQQGADKPLTADMAKALPGGTIDDTTFDQIEHALDRAGAPACDESGKWLTLSQRIAALASQGQEG